MIKRLAKKLTSFLLDRDVVRQEEAELYAFGFQAGLEFMSCLIITLIFSLLLHRVVEYLLFLIVFIPVRSYAGGFHFEKFGLCFLGSCLLIVAVIMFAPHLRLTAGYSTVGILMLLLIIRVLPPVDHRNRTVTKEEQLAFRKILQKILVGIGLLTAGLYLAGRVQYLNLILLTLLAALVSMLIGKGDQGLKYKS